MRKAIKISSLLLLILSASFVMFACAEDVPVDPTLPVDTNDPIDTIDPSVPVEAHALAGEYEIDISDFGMPLIFYLRINDDGTFTLCPNRNFMPADSRGDGQLAASGGTHMMIYEGHTSENPKTATFTLDGKNLVFQSTLPYGTSNIAFSVEDPDDPEAFIYLTANVMAHEEYYGLYAGSHDVSAMGSLITYTYTMTLGAGLKYSFESTYMMGGTVYSHSEVGSWDIVNSDFTLTPKDGDAVVGTITDGVISTSIKASHMAQSRTQTTMMLATHAQHSGSFIGKKVSMMYTADVTLELDFFGGYTYTADVGSAEPYVETGQYNLVDTTLTLTPEEGDAYDVTLQNHVLTGNFKVIGAMPATALTFYNSKVQGTFTGTATHEEVEYTTTLILLPNGTYDLTIVDENEVVIVEATGAFSMLKTMMIMVILADVTPQPNIALASGGLNFSIVLPGMDAGGMGGLGFSLTK